MIRAKRIYEPKKDDSFDIQKVLGEAIQKSITSSTDQTKTLVSEFERMSSDAGVKKLEEKFYQYIKNLRIEKEEIKQDVYKSIENRVNEIGRRVENHEHKEYLTQEDKDECINSAEAMVNEAVVKFDNLFKPFLEQLESKSDKEHTHSEFVEIMEEIEENEKELEMKIEGKAEKKHTHKIRDIENLKEKLDKKADKDHKHDEYATRQELEFIAMQKARGAGGGGHVIQEEGVVKAQRSNLNFIGATVTDDPNNNATVVIVTGGGGTRGTITGTLSDQTDLQSALDGKQATLVSGTNIKTINGSSLLGSGDLTVGASSLEVTQNAHGFIDLDWLYFDTADNTYKKAQSNSETTLGMWHVVEVVDTNTFKIAKDGVHEIANALAVGEYVLSPDTAGGYTQTIPGDLGDLVLYGMEVLSATEVSFYTVPAIRVGAQLEGTGTTNELAYWIDANTVGALPVATYPNLTELSYVKGVTSSIQTQLNAKQAQSSILDNTTASFTTADETKLDNITVTQAVDLDQMETDIAALANGMVYKGNWDASAGTFPGAGVAQTGRFYTVSVGGTVDSVVFNVDDRLVATTDNASATTYAGNWTKLDATDAVTSVNSQVGNVVLDADDIDDASTAHKFVTATDLTTLSNTSGTNTGDQDLSGLVPYTGASTDLNLGIHMLLALTRRATTSAGMLVEASNGTDIGLFGLGNTANVEWYGSHNFSTATQDTIAIFTGAGKTLGSAPTATYPDLTELSYLKGVTSAIQTQINAKQASDAQLTSLAGLSYGGNALKVVRVNAGETDFELATPAGVSDGDKGDITVTSSGTVWTVDNDAITYAKMQNVSATDKILGRSTAGAGDVEEITCTSAGRAILDDADATAQRATLGVGNTIPIGNPFLNNYVLSTYKTVLYASTNLATATGAYTVNRLYYIPFYAFKDITVSEVGCSITSGNGAGKFRVGIYTTSSGRPNTLLVDSGDISTAATGYISASISQALTAGNVYWLAVSSSLGATFRFIALGGTYNLLGYLSTSTTACSHYYEALSGGRTALPGTSGTLTTGTGNVPAIYSLFT